MARGWPCFLCCAALVTLAPAGRTSIAEPPAAETPAAETIDQLATAAQDILGARARPLGVGQLVVADPQGGAAVRLGVARYHVHVVVQPHAALVQIDQTFFNPLPSQVEGTFVFNLPPGASVSRFAMYVAPTQRIEGELIERARADTIYRSIVQRQFDPALLERIGDNLFRMRVFPVLPRDTKRILLDFTVPVDVGPNDPATQRQFRQFRLPLFTDRAPIWDFRLSGVIRGAEPPSVLSPSHAELPFESQPQGTHFRLQQTDYRPDGDFRLLFQPQTDSAIRLQSYRAPPLPTTTMSATTTPNVAGSRHEGEVTYFQATLPATVIPAPTPGPLDVQLLVDTSSGIRHLDRARRTARAIAARLRAEDRVQLAAVDTGYRPLHDGWFSPTSDEAPAAWRKLDLEFALGGSDFDTSLMESLKSFGPRDAKRTRWVIYLGDGRHGFSGAFPWPPSKRLAVEFAQAHASFAAVATEHHDEGRPVLNRLAAATGGCVFAGDDHVGLQQLFRWVGARCPSRLVIESLTATPLAPPSQKQVDEEAETHGPIPPGENAPDATAPDDLFVLNDELPGSPLRVLGRTRAAHGVEVRLRARRGDRVVTENWRWAFPRESDDVFLGRLWAQRKLDQLHDAELTAGDSSTRDELVRRSVALSQEWSLLTRHTAFLVLESEADYAQWGVTRATRRRYWRPDDAVADAPLPQDWLRRILSERTAERDRTRFQQALREAEAACQAGGFQVAWRLLSRVAALPLAQESAEFAALKERAQAGLASASEEATGLLVPRWFEFSFAALNGRPAAPADPVLRAVLRDVEVPQESLTLSAFANRLTGLTGLPVAFSPKVRADRNDQRALEIIGFGRLSCWELARFVVEQNRLELTLEPDRLLIHSPDDAGRRPVAPCVRLVDDLVGDRLPTDEQLHLPPLRERNYAAVEALRERLRRPISFEFHEAPLRDVARELSLLMGANVLVNRDALWGQGFDPLTFTLSGTARRLPARQALARLLGDASLDYSLRHESLMITTPVDAARNPLRRPLSVAGVVMEINVPRASADLLFSRGIDVASVLGENLPRPFVTSVIPFVSPPNVSGSIAASETTSGTSVTSATPEEPSAAAAREFVPDFRSLTDVISNTIAPPERRGAGDDDRLQPFGRLLSLLVSAAPEPLEQVRDLLHDLRRLPTKSSADVRLARAPPHQPAGREELQRLSDVITQALRSAPGEGGELAVKFDLDRQALIFAAPDNRRQDVDELLTLLRRERYALYRADRPWEQPRVGLLHGLGLTRLPARRPLSEYPVAQAEELAALAPRRVADSARWRVQWLPANTPQDKRVWQLAWTRADGARGANPPATDVELSLPQVHFATHGPDADVTYPALRLVEHGRWAEQVRGIADDCLPWWPHRSNEELASRYEVRRLASPDDAPLVRLAGAEAPDRVVELAFDRLHGLPTKCAEYHADKLVRRLRFADLAEHGSQSYWRTVVLENERGVELSRWEVSPAPERHAGATGSTATAVRFSPDGSRPFDTDPLFAAVRDRDWRTAGLRLREAIEREPSQPLWRLLRAWAAHEFGATSAAVARDLGELWSSPELARWVADAQVRRHWLPLDKPLPKEEDPFDAPQVNPFVDVGAPVGETGRRSEPYEARWVAPVLFARLTPADAFAFLSQQPADSRTPDDHERLGWAAAAAGRNADGLRHLDAVKSAPASFARESLRIGLHLRLERAAEAERLALAWTKAHPDCEQAVALAGLLFDHERPASAARVLEQSLAQPGLANALQGELHLCLAGCLAGQERWRHLVAADDLIGESTAAVLRRERWTLPARDQLFRELTDPEVAGQLASLAKQADLRIPLQVRQARLTRNMTGAAAIYARLQDAGELPRGELWAACDAWNRTGQHGRVVAELESRLRNHTALSSVELLEMRTAYESTGRRQEAMRAGTSDPIPPPPPSPITNRGGVF